MPVVGNSWVCPISRWGSWALAGESDDLSFWITRLTRLMEAAEIANPVISIVFTQLKKVIPREDPRIVTVVKGNLNGIVTSLFYGLDKYIELPKLQNLLSSSVATNLRTW